MKKHLNCFLFFISPFIYSSLTLSFSVTKSKEHQQKKKIAKRSNSKANKMEYSSSSHNFYDVTDLEARFSGDRAKASYSYKQSPKSRRGSSLFCEPSEIDKEPHHFLDTCFLCKKLLSGNRDIYMYRGDTPFCSEDCRSEQIVIDEAREKGWKHSSEKQKQGKKQKQSSQRIPVWAS